MKIILYAITIIALLEGYALYNNVNGVMFSAAIGGVSAICGGIIGYLKGKGKK